jgi:dipeptidyl aminopeptidase/acylaminoacyl peptidase
MKRIAIVLLLAFGDGLVQLLRAHNVYHELIVFPDDTHEPLLHSRYLYAFNRLEEFIGRFLGREPARTTAGL